VNALRRCARQAPWKAYRDSDPVRCPRRYRRSEDREVAALIAALLAFGRVSAFLPAVEGLLERMGSSPRDYVGTFRDDRDRDYLDRFRLRIWKGDSIRLLLRSLRRVLEENGNLEEAFLSADADGPRPGPGGLDPAGRRARHRARLARLAGLLSDAAGAGPRAYRNLVVDPGRGSAAKRWNLFLRWVVRPDDGVDLGIWKRVSPRDLVIPLDVHVGRISLQIGLRTRRTLDWRAAEEVTDALAAIDPRDPLRFDLPLSHLGISEGCRGRSIASICGPCPLRSCCRVHRAPGASPSSNAGIFPKGMT